MKKRSSFELLAIMIDKYPDGCDLPTLMDEMDQSHATTVRQMAVHLEYYGLIGIDRSNPRKHHFKPKVQKCNQMS